MDPVTYQYILQHPDLLKFLREYPIWYRYLSRDPNLMEKMEKEAKEFSGKTFTKRVEKLGEQAQMVSMLIQLAGALKD